MGGLVLKTHATGPNLSTQDYPGIMKIDILVCKGEANQLQLLQDVLAAHSFTGSFHYVSTLEEMNPVLNQVKIDLVLLFLSQADLIKPKFYQSFTQLFLAKPLCLVANYDEKGLFWLKYPTLLDWVPNLNNPIRTHLIVNRLGTPILSQSRNLSVRLFLKIGRQFGSIEFDDILYVKADLAYCMIYMKSKAIKVNYKISELEAILPMDLFRRIHKSYVVPIRKITHFDAFHVYIGTNVVPMGKTFRSLLFKELNILLPLKEPSNF